MNGTGRTHVVVAVEARGRFCCAGVGAIPGLLQHPAYARITTVTSYRSAGDTESRSAKSAVQCRVCLQYVKALESYGERKRAKLLP
jgi:hypothetical protein